MLILSAIGASTTHEWSAEFPPETRRVARLFLHTSPEMIVRAAVLSAYSDGARMRHTHYQRLLRGLTYQQLLDAAGIALNPTQAKITASGGIDSYYKIDFRNGAYGLASLLSFADTGIRVPTIKFIDTSDNPRLQALVYADLMACIFKYHTRYALAARAFLPAWKKPLSAAAHRKPARATRTTPATPKRVRNETIVPRALADDGAKRGHSTQRRGRTPQSRTESKKAGAHARRATRTHSDDACV